MVGRKVKKLDKSEDTKAGSGVKVIISIYCGIGGGEGGRKTICVGNKIDKSGGKYRGQNLSFFVRKRPGEISQIKFFNLNLKKTSHTT